MEAQSGENHKLIFINVCRHQSNVTRIVDTNLLETPISLTKHQQDVRTNLLETPIYSTKHQFSNTCRNQPIVTISTSTKSLETPISSLEHGLNKVCEDTNPISSYT
jgi:hypothetical protein